MKFRKITAAMTAAVFAATSIVAVAPMSVSAKEVKLPIKTYSLDTNGPINAQEDQYSIYSDGTFNVADVKTIEVYFTGVTTSYIQPVVQLNQQTEGWKDGIYPAGSFEPSISGGTSTLTVELGTTKDKDGKTIEWSADEKYVNKSIAIYFGWMNAGSCSLNKVILKDASGNVLKTIEGETVETVTPTADVPLTAISETNSEKTCTAASWDSTGKTPDNNTWTANFLSEIRTKASAAYYESAIDYLNEFNEITFKIKVNDFGGDVKLDSLTAQIFYSATDYSWSSGLPSTKIEATGTEYTLTLPVSSLPKAEEKTLAQLGIQFYDDNFTTIGHTGMLDYSVEATLALKANSITVETADNGIVTADVEKAKPGETVTLSVTPDTGYKLKSLTVVNDTTGNEVTVTNNKFEMPNSTVTVSAVFEAIPYEITVSSATNGTVTVKSTTATVGETVTVKTTPASGYELDTLTVKDSDGKAITVTGGKFTMPAKEVTVTATFKKTAATVLAEAVDAANEALDSFVGTNSTTADNVLKAVNDAINNADVTSAWDKAFAKTDATKEAPGSITGSIKLTEKSGVTTGVAVEIEIAQLPVKDEDKVAAAKTAAEKVLSGIKATNDITSDDILKKIKEAIIDTEAAAEISGFTVKKATSSAEGSVTGTVKLSSGNVSDTVAISFTIDKLAKTDAEIIAEAETAAKTVTDKAAKAEDITAEAITKAINNADITVAVKSEVTKEATTAAEGETTVTVTLTLNKETKTITKTFSIAKLEETPAETGNEIKELFTESKDLGTGWDQYVEIPKSDVKIGDTIRIKVGTGSDEYHQVKIMDGGWNVLTSPENVDEKYGTIPVDKDGFITFKLNADDAKAIREKGLIISGYDITVNGAEAVLLEDAAVNVPVVPKGGTKVDAVYTEADENGNIVEQIAVFAISEEDAKNYDSYVVTITRSSDNKKVTVIVDECYKYVTYNEGSKDVRVSSSGAYTVLLDITGISSDFGSLTIEIAPNTAKG